MKNLEIFYAKARNSGNLSHFHGTRTLILSWMHVKYMPDNGPRKRMLSSTLFPNGLSRLGMWLNAESDDLKLVRTPLNVFFTAFKSIFLSLSMHPLPRMNVMLDFIWTLPVQLWGTWNKWTLQKILIHGRIRTIKYRASCFPACPSKPLGYRDSWRYEIRTFTVLIIAPIL